MSLLSALTISGVLALPLQDKTQWHSDKFTSIPENQVSFSDQGMTIDVKSSAGLLIHTLKNPGAITGLKVSGEFIGLPTFTVKTPQGQKGADDYALRIGLVVPGSKKLSGVKKFFAPEWVKNLYARFSTDFGLDHVQFYNVTQDPAQVQKTRTHPGTDLIKENFFALVSKAGAFTYAYDFATPVDTVAIWLSIDGDDTKSTYTVKLNTIELKTK